MGDFGFEQLSNNLFMLFKELLDIRDEDMSSSFASLDNYPFLFIIILPSASMTIKSHAGERVRQVLFDNGHLWPSLLVRRLGGLCDLHNGRHLATETM